MEHVLLIFIHVHGLSYAFLFHDMLYPLFHYNHEFPETEKLWIGTQMKYDSTMVGLAIQVGKKFQLSRNHQDLQNSTKNQVQLRHNSIKSLLKTP